MCVMRAWVGTSIGNTFVTGAGVVLLAITAAPSARAQQAADTAPARHVTTADFGWLSGSWEGRIASGVGVAHVVFGDASGGVLTGVMHLVSGEGKVLVVELITIADSPRGVEMRFRHFSPSLDAYETEFKQTMLLTSHAPDRDVFENQVPYDKALMSTQPRTTTFVRQGPNTYTGRSAIIDQEGKAATIEGVYRRVK